MRVRHPALRSLSSCPSAPAEAPEIQVVHDDGSVRLALIAIHKALQKGEMLCLMADRTVAAQKRRDVEERITAEIAEVRLPFKMRRALATGREHAVVYDVDILRETENVARRKMPSPAELTGAARLVYDRCAERGLSPSISSWSGHTDKVGMSISLPLAAEARAFVRSALGSEEGLPSVPDEDALRKRESEAVASLVKERLPLKIAAGVEADQRTIDVYAIDFIHEVAQAGSRPAQTMPTVAPQPQDLRGAAKILWAYCEQLGLSPRIKLWSDAEADRTGSKIVIPVPSIPPS